jgi:putative ABC transport system substrate-binding protein
MYARRSLQSTAQSAPIAWHSGRDWMRAGRLIHDIDPGQRLPHHPGMDRRRFLLTSVAGAVARPLGAAGQPPGKVARIGILSPTSPLPSSFGLTAVLSRRLPELGWMEGQGFVFERRYADGRPERLPGLAADLVRVKADVIVAVSPSAITAARDATRTVPVVMAFSGIDPVKAGFVASLARPGGNVTGLTSLATAMTVKRLEVLKEALPKAARIAVLVNRRNPSAIEQLAALKAAAPAVGVEVEPVEVAPSGVSADAFAAMARTRADALLVFSDPELYRDRQLLVDHAARMRLPAFYEWRDFVEIGGLLSYGASFEDVAARVAVYVDKILRGARPADLPVEEPTKFELVINMKTARALGLTIPPSLLAQADQVIE